MGNLADLYRASDAVDLAVRVRGGHMSASELAASVIKGVESLNPGLNAVICRPCDIGRRMPPQVYRIAPLAGVSYVLKECGTGWQGVPATGVSRFPQDPVATDDRHIPRGRGRAGTRAAHQGLGWARGGGAELPVGVYFARLEFAGRVEARKIVLAR